MGRFPGKWKSIRFGWLPVFLGAAWPLAFAPFHCPWLAFVLLALLFSLAYHAETVGMAAATGFFFGVGAFSSGIYWLSITLHNFARMDWVLAAALVGLLAAYCAIFPAMALWAARYFGPSGRWVALPALWILSEFVRARFATGFPWLATGYTQAWSPLAGYAPWLGQYGTGLSVAAVASCLAWMLHHRREFRGWSFGISFILLVFAGSFFGAVERFTHPDGVPLRVRLVQGNVPISEKWDPGTTGRVLDRYARLIAATPKSVRLVILPETAFPVFPAQIPALLATLREWSKKHHATLVIGIPEKSQGRYYNAAMEIDGHTSLRWYRKQHLVPFGEYIPFPSILGPLVHHFLPGLGSFTAGHGASVLPVTGQLAGMTICYEESFSRDVLKGVRQGATFLVNISDYAWYGHSSASAQTLQMAAMQSLQQQKPDVRATNTGITAVIGANGRVLARLPQFVPGALDGVVQPMAGETPFGRFGNWPYLGITGVLLIVAFLGMA